MGSNPSPTTLSLGDKSTLHAKGLLLPLVGVDAGVKVEPTTVVLQVMHELMGGDVILRGVGQVLPEENDIAVLVQPSPYRRRRCSPHLADNEDTGTTDFSRLNVGRRDSRFAHRKSENIGTRMIRRRVASSVRLGRASQASTWKLRAAPCRHHSQKCSQLLVNNR
jgi:hypothetical protein